uniref:TCR/Tet family MFS transporter n=2 Tax=Roseivirga sp. TaxID=1964215 RepID=UPI004048584F
MSKRTPALGFIFITVLIDVIGIGIIIPVMPQLLEELGAGSAGEASMTGGILLSSYAIMQFFFAPILGGLSDKYGRRLIILISLFGLTIDYLFLALAPTIALLFVGRIIAGIGGASFTTASAYIADVSTPEKRAQNFGLLGAAFGLGFVLGPAIGGFLGDIGTRIPFFAAAGLTMLNWIYGFFILPESLSKENRREFSWKRANPIGSLKQLRTYPLMFGLITSIFIIYIATHSVNSNWSFFNEEVFDWSPKQIGLSLTYVGVLVSIVQALLVKVFIKRFGVKNAIYTGLVFNALGLILFSMVYQEWMIYAVTTIYVLGGIAGPSLQGIMSNMVPSNQQGELMGAITSLQNLANIIGPFIMTSIFFYFTSKSDLYFPGAAFALGSILIFVSILFAAKTLRNYQPDGKIEVKTK